HWWEGPQVHRSTGVWPGPAPVPPRSGSSTAAPGGSPSGCRPPQSGRRSGCRGVPAGPGAGGGPPASVCAPPGAGATRPAARARQGSAQVTPAVFFDPQGEGFHQGPSLLGAQGGAIAIEVGVDAGAGMPQFGTEVALGNTIDMAEQL